MKNRFHKTMLIALAVFAVYVTSKTAGKALGESAASKLDVLPQKDLLTFEVTLKK